MTAVLTDLCKNALLDSAVAAGLTTTPHFSLHTGFPPAGGNEVTGGSPAYARKPFTWSAAATGVKVSSAAQTVDVPATTVRAVAVYDALTVGTQKAWSPAGASARRAFTVNAAGVTADAFDSPAHGLVNGNSVLVWTTIGAALPTGVSEDTEYFVVGATTDTFQLALTSGGAAINITAIGDGDVQKFVPEVFAGQGTYQVTTFTVSLPG
jgi:hypothetical protein